MTTKKLKLQNLTRSELVSIMDKWLRGSYIGFDTDSLGKVSNGALTDIQKALIEPAPDLAIFILGTCFIDAMASFRFGVTKTMLKNDSKSGDRFQKFATIYLPQYNSYDLYKYLRCDLVHNYVVRHYAPISGVEAYIHHLKSKTPTGELIIHRYGFIEDLKSAYKQLRKDILTDDKIFRNAKKRYLSLGLMSSDKEVMLSLK